VFILGKALKLQKVFIFILKSLLGVLAFYFIYRMVEAKAGQNFNSFFILLKRPNLYGILFVVTLLMIVNWSIEALKWQFLVAKVEFLSLRKAFESLLSGLNLAIFTPARIGEYGGRILYLKPENRKRGAVCMFIGNLSQMVVTILVGLAGLFFWIKHNIHFSYYYNALTGVLFLVLGVGIFLIYLRIPRLHAFLNHWGLFKKEGYSSTILKEFSRNDMLRALLFSLVRYLVFSNQYILLLFGLMEPHSYFGSFLTMGAIFMAQSLIPSFIFVDLGIRGVTASFFLTSIFGKQNIIPILASSFYIWFVNIIIPAIVGIYYVLKIKEPFGRN
jgi:hypothetical protein